MVELKPDRSTIDLTCSCLKLRSDLIFVPQPYRDQTFYHIEVPSESRFFRIGSAEYVFVSLLDGKTSFAEALTITAQKLGPSALTQSQALTVYTWLVDNELAVIVDESTVSTPRRLSSKRSELLKQLNPFWIKLPLCRPDRFITAICPSLAWVFSPPAVICALGLLAVAIVALSAQWDRFVSTSEIVFSPANWLWMLLAWVLLKIVHEFGHGIACKRYGGEVREMGIVFILLAPMAYVDVTSSWQFASKWRRINVAVAGIYIELVIAALAVLVWSYTRSELVAHLLYNIVLMASISTVAFNLNPLMRFDGYYILSDFLEIPNLYSEGSQAVRRLLSRWFYGKSPAGPERAGRLSWIIATYGVASLFWRIMICASLALVASSLFRGVRNHPRSCRCRLLVRRTNQTIRHGALAPAPGKPTHIPSSDDRGWNPIRLCFQRLCRVPESCFGDGTGNR